MTKDTRRERTKKQIQEALVRLLKTTSFDKITTISIAREAGISRSSFYTHYKDKYEMIDTYQSNLFEKLEDIFSRNEEDYEHAILEVFRYMDDESLFATLLTENGTREIHNFIRHKLQTMISRNLKYYPTNENMAETFTEYRSVYLSHAILGVYQLWIGRGKKESPEEITRLLIGFIEPER